MEAIKFDEIVDSMDMQTDEAGFYLNKKTGEIIFAADEDGNPETEKFEDKKLRDVIIDSIKRKGAFRRFKDMAYRHGILENWYEFKNIALKQIAINWCKENNINYTD